MNTFDSRPNSATGQVPEMHLAPHRPASASAHIAPYMTSPLLPSHEHGFVAPHFKSLPYTLPSPATFNTPYNYYPVFDAKRTVSHAHPLYSAEPTASSRYSHSPPMGGMDMAPPTAAPLSAWQTTPLLSIHEPVDGRQHINPNMISSYAMSRSVSNTSGTSDNDVQRLVTPHLEHRDYLSPIQEVRKVSDNLRPFDNRYDNGYVQPGMQWGRPSANAHMQERKPDIYENDYERERQQRISGNNVLLQELGLSGGMPSRGRHASSNRRPSHKKRLVHDSVRSSPRIASLHRSTSYADLDGGSDGSEYSEDSYDEDDDRMPLKRGRGFAKVHKPARMRKADLSLWGLFQVYPQILDLYPLFYYTLLNDLSINSDSVPLIGSIANTVKPLEKAETLRNFFHRGRRVLSQLDAFTTRCDRKYEGPLDKWPEMDHHTRIAIRDVRRKVVERCENYKYTRRDILNKAIGKNNWPAIEDNMIEWKHGMNGDPAGDISHVSLTQPSPPAHIQAQAIPSTLPFSQSPQQGQYSAANRQIRPMPSRARLASGTPRVASMDIDVSQPSAYNGMYPYSAMPSAMHTAPVPPMYGEDNVPMTMTPAILASQPLATPQPLSAVPLLSAPTATWQIQEGDLPRGKGEMSPVEEIVASMEERAKSEVDDEQSGL